MINKEIRDVFFSFFEKKGHQRVLSSPLIPAGDPTLLFTNAGMNQFKDLFLGAENRGYNRAVSIQKCLRVSGKHNDFDEVGKTEYHHTFFEMLGNFSFQDYFKEKAIEYAWEILTEYYKLPAEKLRITVFKDDHEAFKIWEEKIGIPAAKITGMGEKDNFWQMGDTGPCGPCSEIHYDRGESFGPEEFTSDNKRFVELWNLVFMQFYKDDNGKQNKLAAPSIDTGMGLERLAAVLSDVLSNYDTDLFKPIKEYTARLAGIDINNKQYQVDLNVIADHARALSFLISDGILPANDGRGYVLRRILRRAAKHGRSIGFKKPFLHEIGIKVSEVMKDFYPELEFNREFIAQVVLSEEKRFNLTLQNGLARFEEILKKTLQEEKQKISGEQLFLLSDTYGFPLDFARDLAKEKDVEIDFNGFNKALKEQRERSRLKSKVNSVTLLQLQDINKYKVEFIGYKYDEAEAEVLAVYADDKPVTRIKEGEAGLVIFDQTPFYAESGGQVSDIGRGKNQETLIDIYDVSKTGSGVIIHSCRVEKGQLKAGDNFRIQIDKKRRKAIAVHHTVTHILHWALREVIGLHVKQAGSFVGPDKLRFDFTHYKGIGADELFEIEKLMNQKIRENVYVNNEIIEYNLAIDKGAIAIFDEKYSDIVRLIYIGDFSLELCGGTHLNATGEAGFVKILSESSISSGIRRIEAVAGGVGLEYMQKNFTAYNKVLKYFKQKSEDLLDFLIDMEKNNREKEKIIRQSQKKSVKFDPTEIIKNSKKIDDIILTVEYFKNLDKKQLSDFADRIVAKSQGVCVLFTNSGGKSLLVISVHRNRVDRFKADSLIKEAAKLAKGKGGGRPNFAQAGGDYIKNPDVFKKLVEELIEKRAV